MKRHPSETFEDYKKRRSESNLKTEKHLQGSVVKEAIAVPKDIKKFRKMGKRFETVAPTQKGRLLRSAQRLKKEIKKSMKPEVKRYHGVFNYSGYNFRLWTYSESREKAFLNFINQIAKRLKVGKRTVLFKFNGDIDNYEIKEV